MSGQGTLICSRCGGPKRMLKSKVCGKPACRTHGWRQVGHRIVQMNLAKRGELVAHHVVCPYCAAEVPIPDEGEIKCPRCRGRVD